VRRAAILIIAALSLIGAESAAALPIVNEQLERLDATQGTVSGMAGPVTTAGTALDGKGYIVRVRGTYSAYDRRLMLGLGPVAVGWHLCGQRERARGQDAEFIWGLPLPASVFCPALPIRHGNLMIDDGSGFAHHDPAATLPEPTELERTNRYDYLVLRTNGDGPISVGLLDSNLTDNVGALRVRVRRLRTISCVSGGWTQFGDAFADEAACLARIP
jgi:hypothetical protein